MTRLKKTIERRTRRTEVLGHSNSPRLVRRLDTIQNALVCIFAQTTISEAMSPIAESANDSLRKIANAGGLVFRSDAMSSYDFSLRWGSAKTISVDKHVDRVTHVVRFTKSDSAYV